MFFVLRAFSSMYFQKDVVTRYVRIILLFILQILSFGQSLFYYLPKAKSDINSFHKRKVFSFRKFRVECEII